jgi:hypothetical protein
VTVLLDDHLVRDWLSRRDEALVAAINDEAIATTNLWYARLCKTAARAVGGAVIAGWGVEERRDLIQGLVTLPAEIVVAPMRSLAWMMGELISDHLGLSALGAEAIAAARTLDARLLVSSRDDRPRIRRCCSAIGVRYETLPR